MNWHINELVDVDKAYLAGFYDGEGSIILQKKRGTYGLVVKVSNTSRGVIDWVRETVGHGCVTTESKKNPLHKDAHIHCITGKRAGKLLEQLRPYLKIKQDQADVALEFIETLSSGRSKVPERFNILRDELKYTMTELNKTGVALA